MDLGNVCGLYLVVPWRTLEIVHERCQIVSHNDQSLYGLEIGNVEEVEVLPFTELSDEHVTKLKATPTTSTDTGFMDVWRLRGCLSNEPNSYSFILMEQHLTLYRKFMTKPNDSPPRASFITRLHGAPGSGKSHALMYILFRELASGRGCVLSRRNGRVRLLYYLDGASGQNRSGRLIQISGFDNPPPPLDSGGGGTITTTTTALSYIEVKCLHEDDDYIDWERVPLSKGSLESLLGTLFTRRQHKYELSNRVLVNLVDGGSVFKQASGGLSALHTMVVGPKIPSTTSGLISSEWYWNDLSPFQVACCRHFNWKRVEGGETTLALCEDQAVNLSEYAGGDLRLASVIYYWNNSLWLRAPLESILAKLPLSELLAIVDSGRSAWTEDCGSPSIKSNVISPQLKAGSANPYDHGFSCTPLMQKVASSKHVKILAHERLSWFPRQTFMTWLAKTPLDISSIFIVSALARQLLSQSGLELKHNARFDTPSRVSPEFEVRYGLDSNEIFSPMTLTSPTICFVSLNPRKDDGLGFIMKKPSNTSQSSRTFELIGFKLSNKKKQTPRTDAVTTTTNTGGGAAAEFTSQDFDLTVHVRMSAQYTSLKAMQLIRQSPTPWKEQVWLISNNLKSTVISHESLGPRLRWLFGRVVDGMKCSIRPSRFVRFSPTANV